MSLKQFPSFGAFKHAPKNTAVDSKKDDSDAEGPPPRLVGRVIDVEEAWEMLEKKRGDIGEEHVEVEGLSAVGRLDAARIAAAAGVKVDANFTIAQAVSTFKRNKFNEIRLYILFLALFMATCTVREDRGMGHLLVKNLELSIMGVRFSSTNGKLKQFDQISTTSDFWEYTRTGMGQYLFSSNNYDPVSFSPLPPDQGSSGLLYLMKYNQLVQPLRIRQLRTQPKTLAECKVAILLTNDEMDCWPAYEKGVEDTEPIPGWPADSTLEYLSEDQLLTASYNRFTTTTYGGGGFVIDVPLLTSELQFHEMIEHLRASGWVSRGTRVIFFDLCMYNPEVRFFTSVRLTFEFMPYGDVRASSSFRTFKGPPLSGSRSDLAFYALQYCVWVCVLLLMAWDAYKIHQMGAASHFKSTWNLMNLLNYIIFMLAYSTTSGYHGSDAFTAMGRDTPDDFDFTKSEYFDFEALGSEYNQVECLTGINALLSWLRLLMYAKYFHIEVAQLIDTVAKCALDCSIWFLMLAVILFAYAQAFYICFGPEIDGFNSFREALSTMCVWSFKVADLSSILSADQFLASVLFVSFQFTYSVVLINMFIVVLLRSYIEFRGQHETDPIAGEVRKSVHISSRRWLERIMLWVPGGPGRSADGDDDHEILKQADFNAEEVKDPSQLLGHDREVGVSDVRMVLQQVQSVHLEVKFLAERVSECAKKQQTYNSGINSQIERARNMSSMDAHKDASGRFKLKRGAANSSGTAPNARIPSGATAIPRIPSDESATSTVYASFSGARPSQSPTARTTSGGSGGSTPREQGQGRTLSHGHGNLNVTFAGEAFGASRRSSGCSSQAMTEPRRGGDGEGSWGGMRSARSYRGLEMAWLPADSLPVTQNLKQKQGKGCGMPVDGSSHDAQEMDLSGASGTSSDGGCDSQGLDADADKAPRRFVNITQAWQ